MKFIMIITIIASIFRFYGLSWDQGYHLHPDERMITMVADRITLENLNPHFFAYGSFPIYLLKLTGTLVENFNPDFSTYTSLNLVGRFLSALFDLGTIIILYFLGKKLLHKAVGLLAAFFYSISALPIQLSHFWAVDTPLTFFTILTLYLLIRFYDQFNAKNASVLGASFGLALATKTSAILLLIPIIFTLASKAWPWNSGSLHGIKKMAVNDSLLAVSTLVTFLIAMPYAILDFSTFLKQTLEQQEMTKSAFAFPYTLQYVGKIPYLYELKNIFLCGLGPILATLAFAGTILLTFQTIRNFIKPKFSIFNFQFSIILIFFWLYFLVVGSFAIGFMRYLLPLYPLLCLFAATLIYNLGYFLRPKVSSFPFYLLSSIFYLLLVIWPLAFLSIYSQPNTRVQATQWINTNIPIGATIAVEHWDDGLPLGTQNNYQILTLPMYDPDTPSKWNQINQILDTTQYIIIASNRLYVPLQKLTDCPTLAPGKCYPQTANYYQRLFSGQNVILNNTKSVRFTKVAEFSVLPEFSIFNFQFSIDDSSADESFTVYDHPKVMIFQKNMLN